MVSIQEYYRKYLCSDYNYVLISRTRTFSKYMPFLLFPPLPLFQYLLKHTTMNNVLGHEDINKQYCRAPRTVLKEGED